MLKSESVMATRDGLNINLSMPSLSRPPSNRFLNLCWTNSSPVEGWSSPWELRVSRKVLLSSKRIARVKSDNRTSFRFALFLSWEKKESTRSDALDDRSLNCQTIVFDAEVALRAATTTAGSSSHLENAHLGAQTVPVDDFRTWARTHAQPITISDGDTEFADLSPLVKIIGNARVVAFGEPIHGAHEPLAVR